MTLYIDVLFIVCAAIDLLMLRLHARLLSARVKKWRLYLGAALGSFISLESVIFNVSLILIFFQTILILRLVYGKCSKHELLRRFFMLLGVVLVFGAVINMFSVFYSAVFEKNGRLYASLPPFVFLLAAGVAWIIVSVFLFFIKNRRMVYKIRLIIDGEQIVTRGLLDTGNRLCEPKSRRPVIIIEQSLLKQSHERESICFKTAASSESVMDMVRVDSLVLLDENREYRDLYAGIACHSLSENGEFCALLHSEFAKF